MAMLGESEHQRSARLQREGLARQEAGVARRARDIAAAHERAVGDPRWQAVAPLVPALAMAEAGADDLRLARTRSAAVLLLWLDGWGALVAECLHRAADAEAAKAESPEAAGRAARRLREFEARAAALPDLLVREVAARGGEVCRGRFEYVCPCSKTTRESLSARFPERFLIQPMLPDTGGPR